MGKRSGYVMVPEDDPQWLRFWTAYPLRNAKKEARKAWLEIAPTPELVDRMVETLTWQEAFWARTGYGRPYPASWLRAARWEDERPQERRMVAPVAWECPHIDRCANRQMCQSATLLNRPVRAEAV